MCPGPYKPSHVLRKDEEEGREEDEIAYEYGGREDALTGRGMENGRARGMWRGWGLSSSIVLGALADWHCTAFAATLQRSIATAL